MEDKNKLYEIPSLEEYLNLLKDEDDPDNESDLKKISDFFNKHISFPVVLVCDEDENDSLNKKFYNFINEKLKDTKAEDEVTIYREKYSGWSLSYFGDNIIFDDYGDSGGTVLTYAVSKDSSLYKEFAQANNL